MNLFKNILSILIIFIIITMGVFGFFIYKAGQRNGEFGTKTIVIQEGVGLSGIADLLRKEQVILNKGVFITYAFLDRKAKRMQAGVYEINTPVSIKDLVTIISGGKVSGFARVTIPEGFTSKQIAERLLNTEVINSEKEFLNLVSLSTFSAYEIYKYEFLKTIKAGTLEGFLFPDTYEFREGDSVNAVLDKFLQNFEDKAGELIQNYDTLIMASLLEKEVKTEQDMRLVAGVLNNRLRLGMLLQVDATLAYITGKKTGEITNQDKFINSLFNTYKYVGLPPAPIANPGLKAISAALDPTLTDYFYYLSAQDGTTYFAETLEEHNGNVTRYLR